MFVIQKVLEKEGSFTLLDQNKVLKQHPLFRLFATTNTIGLGDTTGLYQGTQQINQGQLERKKMDNGFGTRFIQQYTCSVYSDNR